MIVGEREQGQIKPAYQEVFIPEHTMYIRAGLTDYHNLQRDLGILQAKSEYPVKAIQWDDKIVLLEEHPLMEVFSGPIDSESKESQVKYFGRSIFRSPGVLIQGSESNQITSDHMHKEHQEKFKNISGLVEAHLDWGDVQSRINIHDELVVPPGTWHQLQGVAKKSLMMIITSGSEDCLDKRDHNYRPGNRFEQNLRP